MVLNLLDTDGPSKHPAEGRSHDRLESPVIRNVPTGVPGSTRSSAGDSVSIPLT